MLNLDETMFCEDCIRRLSDFQDLQDYRVFRELLSGLTQPRISNIMLSFMHSEFPNVVSSAARCYPSCMASHPNRAL